MPPTNASEASSYTSIGPPSPEVTGVFCRVPSPRFSRSPWYSLPEHLSRFRVRAVLYLARRFSWQHRIIHFAIRLGIRSQAYEMRICLHFTLLPYPRTTIAWVELPSCVPPLLDYYHLGSRAPFNQVNPVSFQALSISDSPWAV